MFENLTDSLQGVFRGITGRGKLTESNVKEAMEMVRKALLEADVNYSIVKDFVKEATEACLGEDVVKSVRPGDMVVKIVHDQLVTLMGEEAVPLTLDKTPTVIMMVGLHGAGKTTTTAKLAYHLRQKNKSVMLAACDVIRPAAIDQLEALGQTLSLPVYSDRATPDVVQIAKDAYAKAKSEGKSVLILDMAGRLQIDEDMVQELIKVRKELNPTEILLTADSALGQEAVSVAKHFDEALSITGIVLTKLDGDARGGAALSMRKVTGKPIKFITTGEKPEDLEAFRPDGMASRILGMGDIVKLVEDAESLMKEEDAKKLEKKMREKTFDFNDFLDQIKQLRKMGGLGKILDLLPGGRALKEQVNISDDDIKKIECIIQSMTRQERENPQIINLSRRERIAKGSGKTLLEVNQLIKRFHDARQMMSKFAKSDKAGIPGLTGATGGTKKKAASKDEKKKKKKAAKASRKKSRKK